MFLVEKGLNAFIDTVQYSLATSLFFMIGVSRDLFFEFFKFFQGCLNNDTIMSNGSTMKQAFAFGIKDGTTLEFTEFILGHN